VAKDAYQNKIYVEWYGNENVAAESSGSAAISEMRSTVAMKNAGLSVAFDFLTHLSLTGLEDYYYAESICWEPDYISGCGGG
jgi:indolepyruvate ferredoxin oxidoreductase alpha subunit